MRGNRGQKKERRMKEKRGEEVDYFCNRKLDTMK